MKNIILFFQDEAGATAAEYSIMATLIAVVIIGSVFLFVEQVKRLFEHSLTELSNHGM